MIDKILMPSMHRRPERGQTKTIVRSPDQARPVNPPSDRRIHREGTYLANRWSGAARRAQRAAEAGGLRRYGSRPSRPPQGHAGRSIGSQSRWSGRQRSKRRWKAAETLEDNIALQVQLQFFTNLSKARQSQWHASFVSFSFCFVVLWCSRDSDHHITCCV